MLILLLVPHPAKQPNVTNPTSIKLNDYDISMIFLYEGMQHIIAAVVTNVVHSNIHSYAASSRYITQV